MTDAITYLESSHKLRRNVLTGELLYADAEGKVLFGGRLGEYKYYDMDRVIESALARVRAELAK